jgi:hypothetical protein
VTSPVTSPVADWAAWHEPGRWLVDWMPLFSRVTDLFGMEAALLCVAARPDLVDAVVAHVGDFLEEYYTRLASAAEGHADVLGFADDFAGQRGLLIDPETWRRNSSRSGDACSRSYAHGSERDARLRGR